MVKVAWYLNKKTKVLHLIWLKNKEESHAADEMEGFAIIHISLTDGVKSFDVGRP